MDIFRNASANVAVLLSAVAILAGCQTLEGTAPLKTPEASQIKFSDYQPQKPLTVVSPGLLARTLFVATKGPGYSVHVQELLVGPKQHARDVALPGPAVVDVHAGSGSIRLRNQLTEIQIGTHFVVGQAERFDVQNNTDAPIVMQVYAFVQN